MITLQHLHDLCECYVPEVSRHPSAYGPDSWWPAHEIGHLLVATPYEVGRPLFGLDDLDGVPTPDRIDYGLLIECAAMALSGRFLRAAGREDLAEQEIEDTDQGTMYWWWDHRREVAAFVRERAPRVSARGLEARIRRHLALAGR